ncbi:MAG: hypothetical protein PHF57_07885 [Methanoregula sp.]|nr:hypothetical protein [Methanoregula sp.]
MEAGSGDCSLSWALVQRNVSTFTRVCTYDWLGYGWSDPVFPAPSLPWRIPFTSIAICYHITTK